VIDLQEDLKISQSIVWKTSIQSFVERQNEVLYGLFTADATRFLRQTEVMGLTQSTRDCNNANPLFI